MNNDNHKKKIHKYQTCVTQWDDLNVNTMACRWAPIEPTKMAAVATVTIKTGAKFPLSALRMTSSAFGRTVITPPPRLRTVPRNISKATPVPLLSPLYHLFIPRMLGEYALRVAVGIDFVNVLPIYSSRPWKSLVLLFVPCVLEGRRTCTPEVSCYIWGWGKSK